MEKVIPILIIVTVDTLTYGKAVNSGFTLKLNPIFVKDETMPINPAPPVLETPRALPKNANYRREFISKAYKPPPADLGTGCTKQVVKILISPKISENNTTTATFDHFINIPILPQTFPEYKIIVATAPWNMRFGKGEAKPAVIYIVFPEDEENSNNINIPTIYFVKKNSEVVNFNKKDKIDPVIVIDSNRVVTGIKSKEIAKFLKFKNKLVTHGGNKVTR